MQTPKRGNTFFLFVMIFQIITSLTVSPALIYMLSQRGEKINIPFVNTAAQLFSFGLPFFLYLAATRQNPADTLPHKKLSLTNILLIVGMVISVRPVSHVISGITSLFFDNTLSFFMLELYSYPLWIILLTTCVVPALAEEIILRGVTLHNYDGVGIKKAAFINGLFFGILHFNFQQFFYAFFIGFVFSYLVRYTKSIYSSILAHFIFNLAEVLQIYAFVRTFGYTRLVEELAVEPTRGDVLYSLLIQSISAAIMLPVFIILFLSFIRLNVSKNLVEDFLADEPVIAADTLTDPDLIQPYVAPVDEKTFDLAFAGIIVTYILAMVFIFG